MTAKATRTWYRLEASSADPTVADIHIVDIIGDWIDEMINSYWGFEATLTAKSFLDQLSNLAASVKTIRIHINSPGGDVFAALNIANALRDQQTSKGRRVESYVDGLAASAASVIAMAGSKVFMADNALLMVHNPWSIALGEAKDFRKAADDLDTIRGTIVATYKWHSAMENAAIEALLDAATWMNADEAIANGFATDKIEGLKAAASIDRRILGKLNVPEQYKARIDALMTPEPAQPVAAPAMDIVKVCKAADCMELVEDLLAAGETLDQVTAKVTAKKTEKATAAARATEIRAICKAAKQDDLADGYVRGQMSVADVRMHVTTIAAKVERGEINTNLDPNVGGASKARIDVSAVYDALNNPKKQKE